MAWLHKWWNPHCSHCSPCLTCEVLKEQLKISQDEKKELIKSMAPVPEPEPAQSEIIEPIGGFVPFSVKRKLLEEESRVKAEILKKQDA